MYLVITTNLTFEQWAEARWPERLTAAVPDRLDRHMGRRQASLGHRSGRDRPPGWNLYLRAMDGNVESQVSAAGLTSELSSVTGLVVWSEDGTAAQFKGALPPMVIQAPPRALYRLRSAILGYLVCVRLVPGNCDVLIARIS